MRKVTGFTCLAGAFVVVAPVTGSAQTPAAPAATPAPAKPAKKICRTETTTGSNLGGERRCMTAAEWTAENRAAHSRNLDRNREAVRPGSNGY